MKVTALICARGGSKGLPGKNIKSLLGKPLIAWSIEQALAVESIDQVVVSTDSNEIADIAYQFGAQVPFIRPTELAQDDSPEWLVWRHALNYLSEVGSLPDVMVSVPVTAPLRSPLDIESCLNMFRKGDSDIVVTITDSHRSPYFNMVHIDASSKAKLVIPPDTKHVNRRQDAPKVYDMTTVAYVVRPEFVMTHNAIFEGRVGAVYIPPERALDIDTVLDFQIAEYLMAKEKNRQWQL